MATIKPLIAKILIQVGADEPKEIGTIEIPIRVSINEPDSINTTINATDWDPAEMAEEIKKRINPRWRI